jgi:DNA-binding CsgD family transcriptional regulator
VFPFYLNGSLVSVFVFLGGGILGATLHIVLPKPLTCRLEQLRELLVVVSPCLIFAAFVMPAQVLSLVCCIVGGLLCGLMHCSYGIASMNFSKDSYIRIICLATVIASIVALASFLIKIFDPSSAWQIIVLSALQLGAGFLLKDTTGRNEPSIAVQSYEHSTGQVSFKSFWRLLVTVFIFGIICRSCDFFFFSFKGQSELSISQYISHCVAAAFLLFLMMRGTKSISIFYRFALPCTGAGFIFLALPIESSKTLSLFSAFLVGVGFEIINLTAWVLVSYAAKTSSRFSKYFGCYAAVTYLAMFGGRITNGILLENPVNTAFIGLFCVVILVILAFAVLSEQQIRFFEGSLREVEEANAEDRSFIAKCRLFTEHYELTARESEVLELLARGRTLKVVAEKLGISKGTAGTHIANIYRKTNVHRQQDLIDLMDAFRFQ